MIGNNTLTSAVQPIPGDVWHVKFASSERRGYKYRPAIVLDVKEDSLMLAVMVTGAESALALPHDYLLRDWEQAGLRKPSIARMDKRLLLDASKIGTRGLIGRLSPYDFAQIDAIARAIGLES